MFMVMFLAVALGSFLITSCDSPTNGDPGAAGAPGSTYLTGAVSARDLEDAFNNNAVVRLQSAVSTVEGVVPAGRTLRVISNPAILNTSSLEVNGTLEIIEGASLDASYVTGVAGYLKGTGSIIGAGGITLPYLGPNGAVPEGGIHYDSANIIAVKSAGSYRNTSSTVIGSALDNAGVSAIFLLSDGPDELTARNITALTYTAVPAEKELTLTGTGNTITTGLDISSGGTLVIAKDAVLATGANTVTVAAEANITNNGTISTAVTGAAPLITLLKLPGDGKISSGGSVTLDAAVALTQDFVITAGTITTDDAEAPFSGQKTITIESGATLALDADNTSIGSKVVNGGTITTATTSAAALNSILTAGGAITSSAVVNLGSAGVTVPKGTALTASGNVTAGAGPLVIEGAASFTGSGATLAALTSLTVAEDATLTAAYADFAALENLNLGKDVKLTVPAATFVALESLTLGEGVELTAASAVFTAITSSSSITGAGKLTVGAIASAKALLIINSALHEATLGSTTITGALNIPQGTIRTLSGAAAPSSTIAVNGTLIVGNSLALVDTLTIGTNGGFALAGGTVTLAHANAKIAGGSAYEITPDGTTGTLTGDNGVVVFESNAISGYDNEGPLADSAATLAFGVTDSELTIKADTTLNAVILDVAAKGVITVEEGKKLTLGLGADANHISSGGIFTVAVATGTAGGAVKANAVTPKDSSGEIGDADALAGAKVLKLAADAGATFDAGDLAAGATPGTSDPAAGVITGADGDTTIDAADTFEVGAQNAITVTPDA
jgi:hypothetical protein